MKTIRELVEKSPVLWLLTTLLTGFLAGIGAYKSIQQMAGLSPVPAALVSDLRNKIAAQEKQISQKNDLAQDDQNGLAFAKNTIAGKHIDIYTYDPESAPVKKLLVRFNALKAIAEVKNGKLLEYSFAGKYGIHAKGSLVESYLLAACMKIMVPECTPLITVGISSNFFKPDDPTDIRIYLSDKKR